MQQAPTIQLVDFSAAAALTACGFVLLDVQRISDRQCAFVFKNDPRLEETIKNHYADQLSIPTNRYYQHVRSLKSRLIAAKSNL